MNDCTAMQRIAYCHNSEIRQFNLDVLRMLKQEVGSEIHVYCGIREQVSFYDQALADGEIDSVSAINQSRYPHSVSRISHQKIVDEARENERLLGTTYNRMIMGSRTYGRGFSPGGFYHPRAIYAEAASYIQILDAYNRELAVWKQAFDKHRFTLVISPTLLCRQLAEAHSLPTRTYFETGQHNWFFWTTNRYEESSELDWVMARMPDQKPVDIGGTYGATAAIHTKIWRNMRLDRCLRLAFREIVQSLYWHLRGFQKARSYRIRDKVAFHFRRRWQGQKIRRLATTRLSDLKGQRFVFFPLHEEPETVLTIGAPERTNQLSVIGAIARELPAGVLLVVKESAFAIGRRPSEFYQQIMDFKNVVLLDVTERGLEVARAADAVVTIRGTVGQEGGILGRPVIQVAEHGTYHAMPHIRHSDIDGGLRDALNWALGGEFDHARARIDGARFYESLRAVSVDMRAFQRQLPSTYDEDLPAAAFEALKRSLKFDCIEPSLPKKELPNRILDSSLNN